MAHKKKQSLKQKQKQHQKQSVVVNIHNEVKRKRKYTSRKKSQSTSQQGYPLTNQPHPFVIHSSGNSGALSNLIGQQSLLYEQQLNKAFDRVNDLYQNRPLTNISRVAEHRKPVEETKSTEPKTTRQTTKQQLIQLLLQNPEVAAKYSEKDLNKRNENSMRGSYKSLKTLAREYNIQLPNEPLYAVPMERGDAHQAQEPVYLNPLRADEEEEEEYFSEVDQGPTQSKKLSLLSSISPSRRKK
jgi:hypothetical protein